MANEGDVLRRLARSSGLTPREIRRFIELDAIRVGPLVEPALVGRLRRLHRLRRDLGLSVDATAIVVRLLDRIERLEAAPRS